MLLEDLSVDVINLLSTQCLRIATEHGFTDATVAEDLMLMVSELAEALEDYRDGKDVDETWKEGEKPCGIPTEMADVIIRILHFCGKHDVNIGKAVLDKMKYNESRPYKHGKIL